MEFPLSPPRNPKQSLKLALKYSLQFRYPLTLDEIYTWQPVTSFPRHLFEFWPLHRDGFYYLKGFGSTVQTRKSRELVSRQKMIEAESTGRLLKKIPTIKAIFITGSLAVRNSRPEDDIDLLIIASRDTVWITRLLVVFLLSVLSKRRPSGLSQHSSARVADKICDNLYLDETSLSVPHNPAVFPRCFYLAHEILQAHTLWSKDDLDTGFLSANSWTSVYFPVAFSQKFSGPKLPSGDSSGSKRNLFVFLINFACFLAQYIYMRPRFTQEKVGLNYAFFHPRPAVAG